MSVITVREVAARLEALETQTKTDVTQIRTEVADVKQKVFIFLQRAEQFLDDREAEEHNKPQQLRLNNRNEPWRLSLEEFAEYRDTVEADWNDGGNVKVSKALAKALNRSCGHSEGQLYINWCAKVGRTEVRDFWTGRGLRNIPQDL